MKDEDKMRTVSQFNKELAHCPFCGMPAEFRRVGGSVYVACTACESTSQAVSPSEDMFELLSEAWNKRKGKAVPLDERWADLVRRHPGFTSASEDYDKELSNAIGKMDE